MINLRVGCLAIPMVYCFTSGDAISVPTFSIDILVAYRQRYVINLIRCLLLHVAFDFQWYISLLNLAAGELYFFWSNFLFYFQWYISLLKFLRIACVSRDHANLTQKSTVSSSPSLFKKTKKKKIGNILLPNRKFVTRACGCARRRRSRREREELGRARLWRGNGLASEVISDALRD